MDPPLDNTRHLRYWQRCLRTLLPHQYTSNDSTRMTLGCFAVAAVDLLSPSGSPSGSGSGSPPILSTADRRRYRAWVLACQHPGGGFAGGPTHVYPPAAYDGLNFGTGQPAVGAPGEANIAATLFALQLLALVADESSSSESSSSAAAAFAGVDRAATLRWLRRLQRPDGSFGEFLAEVADPAAPGGRRCFVAGGADMRYCYIAAAIRWMLRGAVDDGGDGGDGDAKTRKAGWVEDIDVDALVRYIRGSQTYDGGFSESATHESHGGYAFCAIAALSLLERAQQGAPPQSATNSIFARGIADMPALLRWLSARCFRYAPPGDDDDEVEDEAESLVTGVTPAALLRPETHPFLGFNGRCNKHADTCYTWWTMGALTILARSGAVTVVDNHAVAAPWKPCRRFLLEQTQHGIGGFAKGPGGPPDVYHSYLGLAALATRGEPGLRAFDPAVCVSSATVATIEAARDGLLRGAGARGAARRDQLLQLGRACWGANGVAVVV
ncbi:geranylgeranyl transferase type 1 beta subunit [Niveomyces insectorum RCEF 264]|uniref:Geranylgeranyl transferase type 1 beta subunit n=1 Tax=Niveomyces insectorum RCEF 264 TaxID=1081102 RepID=A0A167UNC4_9HYPO|nr:geranylgeranyl transferase type 1 beta subunit [Niveomyces insectorum RCEF 264]